MAAKQSLEIQKQQYLQCQMWYIFGKLVRNCNKKNRLKRNQTEEICVSSKYK